MPRHPSLITPALTELRLQLLVHAIKEARAGAVSKHEPAKGENEWTRGCVAYARTCFAFAEVAKDHPWLRVTQAGLSCTLSIEGEPVRFFCGEAEHPSGRSLRRAIEEAVSGGRLPFYQNELASEEEGWVWLMVIEPNGDGTAGRVVFLQANANHDTRNAWPVDFSNAAPPGDGRTNVRRMERDGVELPPPAVGVRPEIERAAGGAELPRRSDGGE